MRKILLATLVLFFLCSCSINVFTSKKVHVIIPEHPWEDDDVKLWYTLKWNNGNKIESLYIDKDTREIDITYGYGNTVFICAYPLGEMLPFGCAIVPTEDKNSIVLTQAEGYIAHLLMNSDLEAAEHVNFDSIIRQIETLTYDFRTVDDSTLVADTINGCLSNDSLEIRNKIEVPSISIPNGIWVSEWETDQNLYVNDNKTGSFSLPPGVTRYYSKGLDREFRVVVEANGSVFHSLRYGMIGL